jgi:hypothetical protein
VVENQMTDHTSTGKISRIPKGEWIWVSKTMPKTVIHCDDILEIARIITKQEVEK